MTRTPIPPHQPDPNEAWKETVRLARIAKVPVEIELEYTAESGQPGRKIKLWYDPGTDKTGWKYLDN